MKPASLKGGLDWRRGDGVIEQFWSGSVMHQGSPDAFLCPREPIFGAIKQPLVPSSIADGAAT